MPPPRALAVAVLALAVAAPAADAGQKQESIMQDDRVLTYEGEVRQRTALDEMKALGVDVVHTIVGWRRLSPDAGSPTMPPGFDPANPATYPQQAWNPFDTLVRNAQARGMAVLMTPSGQIPEWASGCPENTYQSCRPKPELYAKFVTALARRYSGAYVDESDGQVLPAVRRWSAWNEPDLDVWLYPQTERVNGKKVNSGTRMYRQLVHAATGALRANGHRRDQILLGETAPIGGSGRTKPVEFYERLFCLRVDRGAAADPGCRRRKRFDVAGVAHHPYTRGAGRPLLSRQPKGAITLAQTKVLEKLIARGAKAKMIRRKAPIYFTEFGVTTNPPDRKFGVSLSRQAEYLNQADYLAFRFGSVRGVAQYEFEDDPGQALTNTFQTGLKFSDGRLKPALDAYRLPLYVTSAGRGKTRIFGQARAGGSRERIEVQYRRKPSGEFKTVRTLKASKAGFVLATVKGSGGAWRLRWTPAAGGGPFYSRVSGRGPVPSTQPAGLPRYQLAIDLEGRPGVNPVLGNGGGMVTSSPGGAACTGPCTVDFAGGSPVTLTATPDASSRFEGWAGGCAGQGGSTCTLTLYQPKRVMAIFRRMP